MLIMNAVIRFSTPPLLKRGHKKKNSLKPKNKWAQPSRSLFGLHFAVYIWAWFSQRSSGTLFILHLPKNTHLGPLWPTCEIRFPPANARRRCSVSQSILKILRHLLHLCFLDPRAVDGKLIFRKLTFIKVSFWIRSPHQKAHTQALNWGRRLRVQGCQHAPKTILSALRSGPA